MGPRMREDTGKGRGKMGPRMREDLWGRGGGRIGPRIREDNGRGGYMRPGIFSPPVRLPSFWPAIS